MEHDFGAVARKELGDARLVLRIADDGAHGERRMAILEFLRDRVQRKLGHLEEHQPRRREARDLAAELGADRAAGAGDQHRAAVEKAMQSRVVERDGVAAEQVVELDRAQRRHAHPARDDVGKRGHGHHRDARLAAELDGALALAVARFRHGDDRLRHRVALRDLADAIDPAFDLHPRERRALLAGIVVQHADHAPLRARRELLDQRGGRGARTQNQHRIGLRLRQQRGDPPLAPGAVGKPAAAHRRRKQDRCDEIDRPRHRLAGAQQREQRGNQRRRDADRD